MLERRDFLKSSLCAGVTYLTLPMLASASAELDGEEANRALSYRLSRQVPTRFYDGKRCWCHPRAGIVPGVGKEGVPRVVMTMNTLRVSGSDVFKAMHVLHTDDLGKTWSKPRQSESLAIRYETINGTKRPVAASDFSPRWHQATKTLLGTGHTVVYTPDWKVKHQPRR